MKKKWSGRVYLGRDENGKQLTKWVGRFETKRERNEAVALAAIELRQGGRIELPVCDLYVDRYLAEYERKHKWSSYTTMVQRLSAFKRDFAGRSLDVSRTEAKAWAYGDSPWTEPQKKSVVVAVNTLYNHAIDEDDLPIRKNPFRRLVAAQKTAQKPPPTAEGFDALLAACSVHGPYAPMLRALTIFATYTLMRPSECFELEWADIDFERMRINKARRLYRGTVDEPKTGPKLIALTAPARDAIIGLPREGRLVFSSKTGKRLSESTLTAYWREVRAKAGVDLNFYKATKHYGVHYMLTELGMRDYAIAAQAGWSQKTMAKMLATYGHAEIGALEEVDAAFGANVVNLREVRNRDA